MTTPADETGWCLSLLHDFTGDPTDSAPAPFRAIGITDDGYIYLPPSGERISLADFSITANTPDASALFALGSQHNGVFAGAPGGVLYAIAHTTDDPFTPQVWSWTAGGGWVHVADLDIGWTPHGITYGRDGHLYALEHISTGTTIQWLPAKDRDFTAGYDWVLTGTGWTTSIGGGGGFHIRLTAAPPATDLTITFPSTVVPVDAGDSFTFKLDATMADSGGAYETVQPTVTVQLTRDGIPWGTPASTSVSAAITATGSSPGAGHTIGAVITVHDNGAGTTFPVCDLLIDNLFGYGLIETYGGAATQRALQVTTGGTVTTLTPLDFATSGSADYRSICADSTGIVWINLTNPPVGGPDRGVNTALRRYDPAGPTVTDFGIQALVDPTDDGNTEAWSAIFCDDQDHVLVPMIRYTTLNESWFLRVTPAGVATRIAGTWDPGGTPPPAATATNVAEGALGTSLANEVDQGWGISLDGKTLYFFDNSDQATGGTGNLLRKLARCAVGGWGVGVRIGGHGWVVG